MSAGSHGTARTRSIVRVPDGAQPPFQVYVNGVPQHEGRDYRVRADALVFARQLVSPRRTTLRFLARLMVAGRYSPEHHVDVVYTVAGKPFMAHALPIDREPA
jgi:predicted ATP-grasp superfamily ATP-dependent carboligase